MPAPFFVHICFVREKKPDWLSRLIMRFEKTKFSHALCLYTTESGERRIFHSLEVGTIDEPAAPFFEDHAVAFAYKVKMAVQREDFLAHVAARTAKVEEDGKPVAKVEYSFSQYINQAMRLLKLPFVPVRNGDKKAICSEEQYMVLRMSKILHKIGDLDQDTVSPRTLMEFLARQTWEGGGNVARDLYPLNG